METDGDLHLISSISDTREQHWSTLFILLGNCDSCSTLEYNIKEKKYSNIRSFNRNEIINKIMYEHKKFNLNCAITNNNIYSKIVSESKNVQIVH